MSDVVTLEYELTEDEWMSAVESYGRRTSFARTSLRRTRLVFGIAMAVLVLMLLWEGSLTAATILALLGTGWVAVIPSISRGQRRRHLRRYAAEGVAHGTFGPHTVALTDEGILDSADGYDWLIHWEAVDRVEDCGGSLLIYNGTHSFLSIPLAAFPDRSTFEAFSERFFRGLERAGRLAALAGTSEIDDNDRTRRAGGGGQGVPGTGAAHGDLENGEGSDT